MRRRLIAVLSVLIISWVSATAQEPPTPPLLAFFNGEMYELSDDTLVSYDACALDEQIVGTPTQSPDGSQFVVTTYPQIITTALSELGGLGDAPLPTNVWLCDTAAGEIERILAAPAADDSFEGTLPTVESVIGSPVWSPDNTRLAWSELTLADTETTSIVIYDVATGEETRTLVDLPPIVGIPAPPGITWGDAGIYITVFQLNEETFAAEEYIYVYDPAAGEVVTQTLIDAGGEIDDFVIDRVRIRRDDSEFFALQFFQQGWVLVDPLTGERQPMDGLPALVAVNADDSRALAVNIDQDYIYNWQLAGYENAQGDPFVLAGYPPPRVTLSPDGQAVAYADSSLHIWRDGDVRDIANSDGFADDPAAFVLWGATDYRVSALDDIAPAPLPTCDNAPQSRLRPGDTGRVVADTIPNNVRDNPSTQANLIGQIPGGMTFEVLSGPVCSEGFAWYEIRFDSLQGWTAEGTGNTYWLAPVSAG